MAKIPILYKYSSIDDAVKIIESKKMKITKPSNFNDPFDCTIPNIDFSFEDQDSDILKQPSELSAIRSKDLSSMAKSVFLIEKDIYLKMKD